MFKKPSVSGALAGLGQGREALLGNEQIVKYATLMQRIVEIDLQVYTEK